MKTLKMLTSEVLWYIIGALGVLLIFAYITILNKNITISNKETKIKELEGLYMTQTELIKANKVDYEKKLKEASKKQIEIQNKYIPIYTSIDTWEGDKNATDNENTIKFLNDTIY